MTRLDTAAAAPPACPCSSSEQGGTQAPRLRILRRPPEQTWIRIAKFAFASEPPGAELECALDAKPFAPCASPFRRKVGRGAHRFRVRAAGGQATPNAFQQATVRWNVEDR